MLKHKKSFLIVLAASLIVVGTAFAYSAGKDTSGEYIDSNNVSSNSTNNTNSRIRKYGESPEPIDRAVLDEEIAAASGDINTTFKISEEEFEKYSVPHTESITVSPNTITVYVNGKKISANNFLYNGTTYISVRAVIDALEGDISYNDSTKTASITIQLKE